MSGILVLILRILSGSVLYLFLGTALYIIWKSFRQEEAKYASSSKQSIRLEIASLSGRYEPHTFTLKSIAIGRAPENDCILEDSTVSAQHARIAFHHAQWWIEDLHSRNGTYINGSKVESPTVIIESDTIQCGDVNIRVHFTVEIN